MKDGFHVVSELVCETLYAWKEAVSPHLAAEKENGVVEDSLVLDTLEKSLGKAEVRKEGIDVFCVVETAGGVASSGPSGTLQCDLYQYVVIFLLLINVNCLLLVIGLPHIWLLIWDSEFCSVFYKMSLILC